MGRDTRLSQNGTDEFGDDEKKGVGGTETRGSRSDVAGLVDFDWHVLVPSSHSVPIVCIVFIYFETISEETSLKR